MNEDISESDILKDTEEKEYMLILESLISGKVTQVTQLES